MKVLYVENSPRSPPLAGFPAVNSFCWGLKEAERLGRGALGGLKLRRVCLFLSLPQPRVSFTPNRERVTRLDELQPQHNYTLV